MSRARVAAERAAALARAPEERCAALELLVLIQHESGRQRAELQSAREPVRLQPGSERARMVLQRALHCRLRQRLWCGGVSVLPRLHLAEGLPLKKME